MVPGHIDRQRGGVLLLILGVAAVIFLAALAKWAMLDTERKLGMQTAIGPAGPAPTALGTTFSKIDTALANFVAQNRRLPCPADGAIAEGAVNAGVESPFPPTGVCNPANQMRGIVPWVTLGISESDAAVPWFGRITYRVDPVLAGIAPLLMNMSNCDVSGTGSVAAGGACRTPTPTCLANPATCTSPTTFLNRKGLTVQDGNGIFLNNPVAVPGTGAAYVLISHGSTGAGAYNKSGTYQPGTPIQNPSPPPPALAAGTNEIPNLNNQALTGATIFMDAQHNSALTPAHFDDYLSHPTISSVLTKANLGPRVH